MTRSLGGHDKESQYPLRAVGRAAREWYRHLANQYTHDPLQSIFQRIDRVAQNSPKRNISAPRHRHRPSQNRANAPCL